MVRLGQELGFALLLAAVLSMPAHESAAQSVRPSPSVPAKAELQQKAHAHGKKAASDPPVPQTPAPPPTLEQTPPTPPEVTYTNGQLTIIAQNATLSQVLRSVQLQTGASIEMPSGASSERMVGQLGPGLPRDVLNALLNGSKFNYIILGVNGNPGAVQKVILTTQRAASPVNTARNNSAPPPEEPQDEENFVEPEPHPQPPAPSTPPIHRRPNMPGRMPDALNQQQLQGQPQPDNSGDNSQPTAIKSPEQLLQELQQMQQQQQQMQEQLNPANRQPDSTKTPEQLLQESQQLQQQQQQMQEQLNPANRQPPQ
jgi:hypothetical protein